MILSVTTVSPIQRWKCLHDAKCFVVDIGEQPPEILAKFRVVGMNMQMIASSLGNQIELTKV